MSRMTPVDEPVSETETTAAYPSRVWERARDQAGPVPPPIATIRGPVPPDGFDESIGQSIGTGGAWTFVKRTRPEVRRDRDDRR